MGRRDAAALNSALGLLSSALWLSSVAGSDVSGGAVQQQLLHRTSKKASKLDVLEAMLREQSTQLELQSARIADLERVVPKEFEVMHYNVLADQAGTNMQPWFCYGAGVTEEERKELHRRFYAMGTANKRLPNKGWPGWAEGVLSPERIATVEEYDARVFAWEVRKHALWKQVMTHKVGCRERSPDVITLAECDHFDDFWREQFEAHGYAVLWRKRPRRSARDGCAIAWRRSTFELEAEGGFDFGAEFGAPEPDRTCAFALLRYKRDPSVRLTVATTHLERDPNDDNRQISRGYQYGTIFRKLLSFAGKHDAEQVPVVLTGDLNAKDCDELAGIARALVRLLRSPTHPLLWSVMDAPTPATTYTEERCMRIDYLLYQSAAVSLTGVGQLPRLTAPIPDDTHPSDHLPVRAPHAPARTYTRTPSSAPVSFAGPDLLPPPYDACLPACRPACHATAQVSARLVLRSKWAQVEDNARQWLACVSGTTTVRPLSPTALRLAFDYFDKDGSGLISHVELEAGMQTLGYPGLDTSAIRAALVESGCKPCQEGIHTPGSVGSTSESDAATAWAASSPPADGAYARELGWAMDLDSFIQVYTDAVRSGSSAMGRQLEKAFDAFDPSVRGIPQAPSHPSFSHVRRQSVTQCRHAASIAPRPNKPLPSALVVSQGQGVLSQSELRLALRRMATAPLDERRLDEVLHELAGASEDGITVPGQGAITMKSFMEWMLSTYTSYLKDPSLVADSMENVEVTVYNQ